MLNFEDITFENKTIIDNYMFKYGENSCQHSFVSMFCGQEKYNDKVCISDGFLFTHREGLDTKNERFYLFPMGDTIDEDKLKFALMKIFDDAHTFGKKVRFETITKNKKEILEKLFPDKFIFFDNRDYYEYIHFCDNLATLEGADMAKKRNALKKYNKDYGDKTKVKIIEKSDFDAMLEFEKEWLKYSVVDNNKELLFHESNMIKIAFEHYNEFEIQGIIVYIDNNIAGFSYGSKLSEEAIDIMVEKGNRNYSNIYRKVSNEFAKLFYGKYKYLNREEDVGDEGLRKSKLSYKPNILLEKYSAMEV